MQAAEDRSTRRVADRYVIETVLGTGGMATVYRALDESLGRTVALKRLNARSAQAATLFEHEYHTLAGLKHPRIIEVFDYGVDSEGPYYSMELLEGADVATAVPLPWRDVCECLRDVGSALALVHGRRLVHRDISPRNVWRTASGAFKVIDFGAMTRFGVPEQIVGTPLCLAPEAATGEPIDQRADLYSLGAVAYYLLSGRHAYPARTVQEVRAEGQPKPVGPSVVVKLEGRGPGFEDAPPALDELILSMLSRRPLARPSNAAEVIERACAIAGLSAEAHPRAAEAHLVSTEFVGRARELRLLGRAISQLKKGHGSATVVDGPLGNGKTRLLAEVQLDARLAGITVLHAEARLYPGLHGTALHLATQMVECLPALAREAAAPHIGTLAHLSGELWKKLDATVALAVMPATPGEARMRVQEALLAWFLAVAGQQKIAVLVDDAHELDEGSAAFLAALARQCRGRELLVVATVRSDEDRSPAASAIKALRTAAQIIHLPTLKAEEMRGLLRSAFGDAVNLPRLAEKLHECSSGNPQHCMELVYNLVLQDVIHYRAGVWILPQEIRDEQLSGSWEAAFVQRSERLSTSARTLARLLHLHGGVLSADQCAALLGEPPEGVYSALEELLREGVATGTRKGCRLVARYAAHVGSMEPERAREVHRKLGESILARTPLSAADKLAAGLHLLRAGENGRAGELLARGGVEIASVEADSLPLAIPTLEAAVRIYKEQGRPPAELVALLAPLTSAGYYADRRLAARYGEETLGILRALLGLDLAAKLRPYLGRKLSLIVGIVTGAIRFKRLSKTRRVPTFQEAFALLFHSVSTLTGVSVICIDPITALRNVRLLEPLTALGEDHVATFMYRFSTAVIETVLDRNGKARRSLRRIIERLRDPKPVRNLPEHTRPLYLGGALYASGVIESWADGPGALRVAEELDAMNMKLYQMSADQVRAMYYANQGNDAEFQHYRSRVETHAIQRGTAWQVEIWGPGALISVYMRNHDAMGMKHARDVLERLAQEIPSLSLYAERAKGAYWVMRGRYAEAIEVLEAVNRGDSRNVVGTTRSIGALARAYNQSGNPARAKKLCEDALAGLDGDDLDLVVMNEIVQTELAIAHAHLGNLDEAERQLDRLIEKHLPLEGPLTLGMLFEARAQVALIRGEKDTARSYLDEMAKWHKKTVLPSLAARSEMLTAALERRSLSLASLPHGDADTEEASDTVLFESDD